MPTTDRSYSTRCNTLAGKINYNFHTQNPAKSLGSSTLAQIKIFQNSFTYIPTCISGNLVVNGDFMDGSTNTLYITPPGWELIDGDGNNQIVDSYSPAGPPSTHAFAAANMYHKSYLRQTIPTVEGVTYTLSYWLFDPGSAGAPWNSNANLIYFSASVSIDNTPIGDVISVSYPAVDPPRGWSHVTSTFIAKSEATLLTFTTQQPPQSFLLTSISVTCQS
jgi:hypothetical protein